MPKKPQRAKKAKRPSKPTPIPPGFRTLTPYLTVRGAAEAVDFYKKASGARELQRQPMPDGRLLHARVKIGDSILMMSDEFPEHGAKSPLALGGTPVTIHLYTKDVDKLWSQAVAAGCKVMMPLEDQFWGERYGQREDPFGHVWSLSMRVEGLTPKQLEEKRTAAMAGFSGAEP